MAPQTAGTEMATQAERAKRRTERILLRIPVEVQGTGADGKPFREKTFTVAINRHGARIALNADVNPESRVTVTNLQNQLACPFRVVARVGKSLSEAPEWGMECLEPGLNFWGIFFPEKSQTPAERELIDSLLECSLCRSRELAQLTLEQYQTVTTHRSLSRGCGGCGAITEWAFAVVEAERPAKGQATENIPQPASAPPVEQRRAKRMTVKLPVRIRLEEVGETENLSSSGICFSAALMLRVGDWVGLTVGLGAGGDQREVPGRVVWRREIEGTNRALYGVQLEDES